MQAGLFDEVQAETAVMLAVVGVRILAQEAYPHEAVRHVAQEVWNTLKASTRGLQGLLREGVKAVFSAASPESETDLFVDELPNSKDAVLARLVVEASQLKLPGETEELLEHGREIVDMLIEQSLFVAREDQHLTPTWFNSLLADVGVERVPRARTVYDPACGMCGTLAEAHRRLANDSAGNSVHLYGQDVAAAPLYYGMWRLLAYGVANFTLKQGDTLLEPKFHSDEAAGYVKQFDLVVGSPPLESSRGTTKELRQLEDDPYERFRYGPFQPSQPWLFVQHALASTSDRGAAVLALTPGVLSSVREQSTRKGLVQANVLDGVALLPAGFLAGTPLNAALVVLQPSREARDVFFVDASDRSRVEGANEASEIAAEVLSALRERRPQEGLAAAAGAKDIQERDFNLSPSPFVPPRPLRQDLASRSELEALMQEALQTIQEAQEELSACFAQLSDFESRE